MIDRIQPLCSYLAAATARKKMHAYNFQNQVAMNADDISMILDTLIYDEVILSQMQSLWDGSHETSKQ